MTLLKQVNMDVAEDLREEVIQNTSLHADLKHFVGDTTRIADKSFVHRAIHHGPCGSGPRFAR